MCMTKLAEFDCPDEGVGYKGFYKPHDILMGLYYQPINLSCYITHKEYKADVQRGRTNNEEESYKIGFHIFNELSDAKEYTESCMGENYTVICKVKYRKVLAKGYHSMKEDKPCGLGITAEYMTILEEV